MTDQHSITPPPELVMKWVSLACEYEGNETWIDLATQAASWGADQELEACCEWLQDGFGDIGDFPEKLRVARRSKPPGLKEQAFALLDVVEMSNNACNSWDFSIVRRALEQLDD